MHIRDTNANMMEIHVETAVRVCPPPQQDNLDYCVQVDPKNSTVQLLNSHNGYTQNYPINYALPMHCCQNTLYLGAVNPLLNFFMEGCDVSVVTIGQQGTGKTYTLYGPGFHFAASEAEHGVVPRFIRDVFVKARQFRDRNYTFLISWSQICGNTVKDLLGSGSVGCSDVIEAFRLIQLGLSNLEQTYGHTLFTLTLEQHWRSDNIVQHRISTASFADLTDSERRMMYDNNGVVQTFFSDAGLQTLDRVVTLLSEPCLTYSIVGHVPYFKSVLTTLLKDSFGGRAKTLVIGCVSSQLQDIAETQYTLDLAVRCQMIKNLVTVNSYTTSEYVQETCDVFGLQFAANQLFKLVTNAEELFQKILTNGSIQKNELEQISQWITLKQECEECLSDNNSDPPRSLGRIEEEIELSDESDNEFVDDMQPVLDELTTAMESFKNKTNLLVRRVNVDSHKSLNPVPLSWPTNSYRKNPRDRRRSLQSTLDDINPSLSLPGLKLSDDSTLETNLNNTSIESLTPDLLKKVIKQVVNSIEVTKNQISDLEQTITVKRDLMNQLLKHKQTKSCANVKLKQKCILIQKQYETLQDKFNQAQVKKNPILMQKYKFELQQIESKLKDTTSLKNITEDGNKKLVELETSLLASMKQLDKLKKTKKKEEKRKDHFEKILREKNRKTAREESKATTKIEEPTKALVELKHASHVLEGETVSLLAKELEFLRHEIRNLRKTRDFILEQRSNIDVRVNNKKLLNDKDERKLLQFEEAIEAIDLSIEYKNEIICGRMPACEKLMIYQEEQGDIMLVDRLLKLSSNEMRVLLHKYFEKVVDLRSNSKKLELQMMDVENQNQNLMYRVQNLNHTVQQVRLESERRVILLKQQHEDIIHNLLRYFNSNDVDVTHSVKVFKTNIAEDGKTVSRHGTASNATAAAHAVNAGRHQDVVLAAHSQSVTPAQTKVTWQKNKLFIQQTNK